MNYHQFLKVAKAMREEATPDIRDRLPAAEKTKTIAIPWRRITAIGAVAAVVAVCLVVGFGTRKTLPIVPTEYAPPATDAPVTTEETPVITGDDLHVVVRTASLAGREQPQTMAVYPGTLTFNFGKGGAAIEHEGCSCVIYCAADGTVFCPTHALQELLGDKLTGEICVKHVCLPLGRILFSCGRSAYFYDLNTGELTEQKTDISSTATLMSGSIDDFQQEYCILEGNGSGDHSAFYLVSMKNGTVEDLETAAADGKRRAAHDIELKITTDGRFARYVLGDGKGNTNARTNVLIDLATREVQIFPGEIVGSTPDDLWFATMTEKGLSAYNAETRTLTAFADSGCPAQFRYGYQYVQGYRNGFYTDYALLDRLTGETTPIGGHISAIAVSVDGTTLYAFNRDKTVIDAYDFLEQRWYTLPLDDDFLTMLRENTEKEINFFFYANADGSVTLTYYVTHLDRVTPEEQLAEEAKYPYATFYPMLQNGEITSIASLRPLMEKFYANGELALYEGDGYAYLDATDFWRSDRSYVSQKHYAVEDYKAGWFYLVMISGNQQEVLCSAKIGKDAAEKTKALMADCHSGTVTAGLSFPYLKNGKVDAKSLVEDRYTSAYILSQELSYHLFPERTEEGWIIGLEHPSDIESLRGFLTFVDGLDFVTGKIGNEYPFRYKTDEYYVVRIHHTGTMEDYDFIFGHNKNGTYEMLYLAQDGSHLASMTAEEYATWKAWAEERIVRQNVPYEERESVEPPIVDESSADQTVTEETAPTVY